VHELVFFFASAQVWFSRSDHGSLSDLQARLTTAKAFRRVAFLAFGFPSCSAANGFDFLMLHVSACAQPSLAPLRVILQRASAYLLTPARIVFHFFSSFPRSILTRTQLTLHLRLSKLPSPSNTLTL
jgi:hypothetical protein